MIASVSTFSATACSVNRNATAGVASCIASRRSSVVAALTMETSGSCVLTLTPMSSMAPVP
jgi:hypothetical protein